MSARRPRRTAPVSRRAAPEAPEAVATVTIESVAAGGDGIGRIDGMACFVPRTAPGDVVQVAYRVQARHARGRALQRLQSSADRVEPRCVHFERDRCGGCQLQHLTRDAQDQARLRIVQDALRRIGHRPVDLPAWHASPVAWAYRQRLTLTLLPRGSTWVGGLHPHDDATRVFPLEECRIADPSLVAAWHAVRTMARGLPQAPRLRLSLRRVGVPDGAGDGMSQVVTVADVAVVVEGGTAWRDGASWARDLAGRLPALAAVWWIDEAGASLALWTRAGLGSTEPLAFAQVNAPVASDLRRHVAALVGRFAPGRVIDAYAGTGDLTNALWASVPTLRSVAAIEADPAATAVLRARAGAWGETRIDTAAVEEVIASCLPADVVVLNPPRRGVAPAVIAALEGTAASPVQAIIYVSCDPATLARDVARLHRWRIRRLDCFDMFPQTAHVETVCLLEPEVAG
jgi:23S rRNA (uracil1939-C5)-methyltransferase